jgi:hypothetical protein
MACGGGNSTSVDAGCRIRASNDSETRGYWERSLRLSKKVSDYSRAEGEQLKGLADISLVVSRRAAARDNHYIYSLDRILQKIMKTRTVF